MINDEALTPAAEQWAINAMPDPMPEVTRELAVTNLTAAFAAGATWLVAQTLTAEGTADVTTDPAEAGAAYAESQLPLAIVATVTPFMALRWLHNAFIAGAEWQDEQEHEAAWSADLVADLTAWWAGDGSAEAREYIGHEAWGSDDPLLTRLFRDAFAAGHEARNARG